MNVRYSTQPRVASRSLREDGTTLLKVAATLSVSAPSHSPLGRSMGQGDELVQAALDRLAGTGSLLGRIESARVVGAAMERLEVQGQTFVAGGRREVDIAFDVVAVIAEPAAAAAAA